MSSLSFLFRTDVHLTDQSPVSWKGDYQAEIWSSLEQIGALAGEFGVRAVLDGGDYFHIKAASRNPHAIVSRTATLHQTYPCPVLMVEGNHDISWNNLETVEKQPLGVLFSAGVFKQLRERVYEAPGLRVRVVGVPFSPFLTLDVLKAIQKAPGETHLIAVVHTLATEAPPSKVEEFFGEPIFRYSDLVTEGGPDVWCFGHWHKDQGAVQVGGKWFVNQGAVSRGSLNADNINRIPKVALVEVSESGVSVCLIPLRVSPADEVFDFEKKERREQEARDVDQFVERLLSSATADPSKSIEENVESLDFAKEVRDLALHYLALAREGE